MSFLLLSISTCYCRHNKFYFEHWTYLHHPETRSSSLWREVCSVCKLFLLSDQVSERILCNLSVVFYRAVISHHLSKYPLLHTLLTLFTSHPPHPCTAFTYGWYFSKNSIPISLCAHARLFITYTSQFFDLFRIPSRCTGVKLSFSIMFVSLLTAISFGFTRPFFVLHDVMENPYAGYVLELLQYCNVHLVLILRLVIV